MVGDKRRSLTCTGQTGAANALPQTAEKRPSADQEDTGITVYCSLSETRITEGPWPEGAEHMLDNMGATYAAGSPIAGNKPAKTRTAQ